MAREETKIVLGAVDNVTPVLGRIVGKLGELNTAFASVGVGGLAALAAGVTKTINDLDRLNDQARALNVTAEALSGLSFAAQQSGASAEVLSTGLTKLNRTLGEAANGNKAAAELFDRLGIAIRDGEGNVISADRALLALADRFRSFKDGAQESAIAAEALGRTAGPELVQFLNQGSEGIQALQADAAALGVVLGDDAAVAAAQFKDNLDLLAAAGQGFLNSFTVAVLPALGEFSTQAAEAAKSGGLLSEAGRIIGGQFNLFGADLIAAQAEIQQLGAEIANAVQFLDDWAENLGVVGNIAIVAFQSIEQAAAGNFVAAERGLNAITGAINALGKKAAADAAARMQNLSEAIAGIRSDAAARIDRIKGGVEGLGKAARAAAPGVGTLNPPIIQTGNEAAKAAPKVDRLAKAIDELQFRLGRNFREGLKPTQEIMQDLVPDIDGVAVSLDQLAASRRDSLAVMNATTTEEAQFFQENWEGAVDAVQDAFADFVAGNIKSFADFGKALESIARQFLANLVRQFLSTNLSLPFPFFGGGGGAAGAGGFGGINFGGPGAALGTRVGLGAAGAGIAYDGYQRGSPLQGAAGGALLGLQVAGPVGAIVGAILGGVAAALNDTTRRINVVGDDIVGTPGFRNFAPGSTFESRLGGFTFASIDNVSAQERQQLGQNIVKFDNTIADLLNDEQLVKVTDALSNFNLRLEEGAISAENILGERFNAILSTFDQDIQDFVNGAATLEERTQRLAEILSRPQRLNALIDSLEEVDRLSGLSPFERELDAINKQFDQAAEEARKLGADQAQLARIEELRGNAIERLNDLQRQNLDALLDDLRFDDITDGLTPADRAIADINRRFDRLREQALSLGASQEDLELIERRRTAALREQADATRDSTDAIQEFTDAAQQSFNLYLDYQADWLEGLGNALQPVRDWLNRGASVSSENPLQQLTRSQQQFEDLARRASLGDFDAIRNIAGAGDALLQQAARFYGVGSADFQRYEALVRGTLTPLASVDGSQSMAIALGQLREIYQALLRFLQGGNGANNSGVMSGAQAQQLLNSLDRLSRRTDRVT